MLDNKMLVKNLCNAYSPSLFMEKNVITIECCVHHSHVNNSSFTVHEDFVSPHPQRYSYFS